MYLQPKGKGASLSNWSTRNVPETRTLHTKENFKVVK
jgi:hypothetical protein